MPNIKQNKIGCEYCSKSSLVLSDNYKCNICYESSFASHPLSKYCSSNNSKKPRQVVKDYLSTLSHFTCSNRRCPYCINKTEATLFDKLVLLYPSLKQQVRFEWCRKLDNKRYMPFDFVLEDYKIIIELDGELHFKQISNWKSPKIQQ